MSSSLTKQNHTSSSLQCFQDYRIRYDKYCQWQPTFYREFEKGRITQPIFEFIYFSTILRQFLLSNHPNFIKHLFFFLQPHLEIVIRWWMHFFSLIKLKKTEKIIIIILQPFYRIEKGQFNEKKNRIIFDLNFHPFWSVNVNLKNSLVV